MSFTFNEKVDTLVNVIRYIDSNFIGSKTNQIFIGGYVFIFVRVAICYSSKLPSIIVLSIYKAGYIAIYKVKKKVVCPQYLLAKLRFWKKSIPVILYTNNQISITLSNYPKFYHQKKHIDVQFYWIYEAVFMK